MPAEACDHRRRRRRGEAEGHADEERLGEQRVAEAARGGRRQNLQRPAHVDEVARRPFANQHMLGRGQMDEVVIVAGNHQEAEGGGRRRREDDQQGQQHALLHPLRARAWPTVDGPHVRSYAECVENQMSARALPGIDSRLTIRARCWSSPRKLSTVYPRKISSRP